MKITFGIITNGTQDQRIKTIIDSIEQQKIPDYEIIVVGNSKLLFNRGYVIPFDESVKNGWITKKKNIITAEAKYDNIVYIHDYVVFNPNWYDNVKSYQGNWDVMMTQVLNKDGTRFRDWLICDDPKYCDPYLWDAKLASYNYLDTQWMYVSGAYWIAKRNFMRENPLDESRTWGQAEDVEWSKRVRHKWKYVLNLNAYVQLLKQQDVALKVVVTPTVGKYKSRCDNPFESVGSIACSGFIPRGNGGCVSG